jgi:predicted permease
MGRQSTENAGWIRRLLRRLRSHPLRLRRRSGEDNVRDRRLQREIEDELTFHLEMRTRENLAAGMSPEEARRRARERFGELERVHRQGRVIRGQSRRRRAIASLIDDLRQDAHYAIRSMLAAPGVTGLAIVALTLGIGATTAIFSVIDGVLLQQLPYRDPERIVMLSGRSINGDTQEIWRNDLETLPEVALFTIGSHEMVGASGARQVSSLPVDTGFLAILSVEPAAGRLFAADDSRADASPVAIVTDSLWRSALGADPTAVGKTITIDGTPFTVIGIMPPGFSFLRYPRSELFIPLRYAARPASMAIGRLARGATFESGRAEATALAEGMGVAAPEGSRPISYWTLSDAVLADETSGFLLLAGAVSFVLLIACTNTANLLLARAFGRRREITVRCALGANRARIARQLFTESGLLALIGGALGVLVAAWYLPLLLAVSPTYLPRTDNVGVDLRVLAFTLSVSMGTGLLFGLVPVVFAGRTDLRQPMTGGDPRASESRGGRRVLTGLVVAEVALSFVLLVGTGLLVSRFIELLPSDPGFDSRGKLTLSLSLPERRYPDPQSRATFYDLVLREIGGLPGVEQAAAISALPMIQMAGVVDAVPEGVDPESRDLPTIWYERASANYHRVMDIAVKRGRPLGVDRSEGAPEMVISEDAARRLWPDADPLGKRITVKNFADEPTFVVVGIAADTRRFGTDTRTRPTVWVRYADDPGSRLTVIVQAREDPVAFAAPVRELIARLDPELPVNDVRTMDEILSASVSLPRFYVVLMSTFSGIAILLATVGFYGMMAYVVSRRTHELGVRVALGASPGALKAMVLRQGAIVAALGISVGLAGCWALRRSLESLFFGVRTTDPVVYVALVAGTIACSFLACYIPARRATRVDPLTSLRSQ